MGRLHCICNRLILNSLYIRYLNNSIKKKKKKKKGETWSPPYVPRFPANFFFLKKKRKNFCPNLSCHFPLVERRVWSHYITSPVSIILAPNFIEDVGSSTQQYLTLPSAYHPYGFQHAPVFHDTEHLPSIFQFQFIPCNTPIIQCE